MSKNFIEKHVVVAENVDANAAQIIAVVREALGDSVTIHRASDAQEAKQLIEDIEGYRGRTLHKVSLVLIDLHMSDNEEGNGDYLLESLLERRHQLIAESPTADIQRFLGDPAVAFVSGTFMKKDRLELAEMVSSIPWLDKGAFSARKEGTPQRAVAIAAIQDLARKQMGQLPTDPRYLELLRSYRLLPEKVSKMGAFIDEVSGQVSLIWRDYQKFWAAHPDLATFLRDCELYDDEITGINLHEFKNRLPDFIAELEALEQDLPKDLTSSLRILHAYINRVLESVVREKPTIDLHRSIQDLVTNIGDPRVDLEISRPDREYEVSIAAEKFYAILCELIRNALRNVAGQAGITVAVDEDQVVYIENCTNSELGFEILNSEVTAGELPARSSSVNGSGAGLRMLLDLVHKLDTQFHLFQDGDTVVAKLHLGLHSKRKRRPRTESAEAIQLLPNVGFLCHKGTPESTFADTLKQKTEGKNLQCLESPYSHEIDDWIEDNRDFLERASCLFVHTELHRIRDILIPIHEAFPHLVFSLATTFPGAFLRRREMITRTLGSIAQRILWPHHLPEDSRIILCSKSYDEADLEVVLEVAEKMAMEVKKVN
jgi:CheY-like chemotaxis protein